jgi:hypothetical protein
MDINKTEILQKLCYTELVYERINTKLRCRLSKPEIEALLFKIIHETSVKFFERNGKNVYITNREQNIRITVNRNTFRVITVDPMI